jgi:hypothetical protein
MKLNLLIEGFFNEKGLAFCPQDPEAEEMWFHSEAA